MTKDELIAKRAAVEEKFNNLKAENESELLRLQGEYRSLTELINESESQEGTVDANTIVAEPKKEKKNG